jgi:hypothetical protein
MNTNLIAFTGLATSGKTTAAAPFVSKGFSPVSFATPIKRMIQVLTLCRDKNERPEALCGKSIREAYQSLGTDWGRKMIHDGIWVEIGRRAITYELLCEDRHGVVIDDLRFNNEALCIKEMGGVVIEIVRPGLVRIDHASENGVSPEFIDFTIVNDSTIVDLNNKIFEALAL